MQLDFYLKTKAIWRMGSLEHFVFYRALATNTLWHALMKIGLWKRVIKDKYIPHDSILSWLRSVDTFSYFGSQSWKNIRNTLLVILHWMV